MKPDNRIFTGSVSIRIESERIKLELSLAELHGGPEGLFRLRVKRRWMNAPGDLPLFFDRVRLAEFIAAQVFGEAVSVLPETAPDLPRNTRVSAKFWHKGMPHQEAVWTATPPIRAFDGLFYVGVMTYVAGFIFVPTDDVIRKKRHEQ